jgi:hypothetical protein
MFPARIVMGAVLLAAGAANAESREAELWGKLSPCFAPPAEYAGEYAQVRSVLTFADGRRVRNGDDWATRRSEILEKWNSVLGKWPALLKNIEVKEHSREAVEDFTRHRIEFEIAPGRKTIAYLLRPRGPGPFPAVVDVFYYPEDGAGLKAERRQQHDFGYQMVKRGFVALCIGQNPTPPKPNADLYYPSWDKAELQPLSYLAYVAANAHTMLSERDDVDSKRIGIVGHSYGGKWAMFAGALNDKFAAVCMSDPGIMFNEARANVNYWEPWYLGYEKGTEFRERGVLKRKSDRLGAYKTIMAEGMDLHELHALIAPRPFFVAGGSEDTPAQWKALNHTIAVNDVLGFKNRVGMHNRPEHVVTPEANERICDFFEYFLKEKR